ncbi:hypothetical protein ABZT06_23840 [Streptomyces sp. NPDC005483]|uniref:hypothetical protein n=1 Tax=Streptomyces sp. NPDC005483 TaxID=3154882 RepID=UPI0033B9F020
MEWTPLAGTGLGAIVGVGSTLLADRVRRRRDVTERTRQERKEIYVACLTKYRQANEDMYAAALRPPAGVPSTSPFGRRSGRRAATRYASRR